MKYKYIDLTHTFNSEMPVYPGDLVPELVQTADLDKDGYIDYQIKTGMHVGTHMDAPLHMIESGKRLSEIEISKFIGRGCLVDARGLAVIGAGLLTKSGARGGDIVLVMTGWLEKYRQPEYYENYPEIGVDFANKAIKLGVKAIGLDNPSPDRPPFKIHKLLLGKEILIIENLTNLEQLIGLAEFEVMALPAKFATEAAPVRVIARIIIE